MYYNVLTLNPLQKKKKRTTPITVNAQNKNKCLRYENEMKN